MVPTTMARDRKSDVTELAELRDRVHTLGERVATLGRHL
jgi:hypothetical protein